jgi:hypothetical protein
MIPDDDTKKRIQQLPQRHWIYLDGKQNPEIVIPTYQKDGEAVQTLPFDMPQPLIMQYSKNQGFFSKFFKR